MPEWIWRLLALVLILLSLALLIHALFKDRARGRRRCPRCWYEMPDVLTCPECGRTVAGPAKLLKTRRRWRLALLALLILLPAYVSWNMSAVMRDGWLVLVPPQVLAVAVAVSGETPEVVEQRVVGRVYSGTATKWERLQVALWARRELPVAADDVVTAQPGRVSQAHSRLNYILMAVVQCGAEGRVAAPAVKALFDHADGDVRARAMSVAGLCGANGHHYVDALRRKLDSRSPEALGSAVALGAIGPAARAALPELIERYEEALTISHVVTGRRQGRADESLSIFDSVIACVVDDDDEWTLLLRDARPGARVVAANHIAETELPRELIVELLSYAALHDDDMFVRRAAVTSLGQVNPGGRDLIPPLSAALRDESSDVRWQAVKAVDRMEHMAESAVEDLAAALVAESDPMIRYDLLCLATDVGGARPDVIQALITCLDDPNHDVAVAAALRLGMLNARTALPALRDAEIDPREVVSRAARQAILDIE